MELIKTWLMSNIWGMLFLGAMGSVLGTILVVLAKKIFSVLFPKAVAKLNKKFTELYLWVIKTAMHEHLLLYFKLSRSKLIAYYASVLARILLWMFVTTWSILSSVFFYGQNIWISVVLLSGSFITFSIAIRSFICLSAAWKFDLEDRIDKAAEKAIESAVEELLPKVLEKFIKAEGNNAN